MHELNKHTATALIIRYNLKDTAEVRSALADAYRAGYGEGYKDGIAEPSIPDNTGHYRCPDDTGHYGWE